MVTREKILIDVEEMIKTLSENLPASEINQGWTGSVKLFWFDFFSKMKDDLVNNVPIRKRPEYLYVYRGLDSNGINDGELLEKAASISVAMADLAKTEKRWWSLKNTKISRILIFSFFGLLLVWFLLVDKSWFVESCPDCLWSSNIIQYRFCTFVIREHATEEYSMISAVADELGVPCSHSKVERWHKQKWWGLAFCCCPCKSGISGLMSDGYRISESIHSKIKSLIDANPNLPNEFKQKVLIDHDMEYWKQFKAQLVPNVPSKN
jgi:hypothetical protein